MNISTLLKAAEYIERKDREAEHGYASSLPAPTAVAQVSRRRSKLRKTSGLRTSHNELEKNRRAHLRNCLERLKSMVPLPADSNRHTTLGLLIDAQYLIKNLEQVERQHRSTKEELEREQKYLRWRLDEYTKGQYRSRTGHTLSESSCISTASSSSVTSEHDEVDVIGYSGCSTGSLTDSDDHSDGSISPVSSTILPFSRVL